MSRIVTVSLSKSGALAKLACLATLASCGHVDYENAPAGKFSGSLFVMWIDDGGALGDGTFVYVPHPDQPLKFTRTAQGSVRTIKPQMMYTDGGSIPRIAQVFQGFNPWGYAPAYIVHDWLFVARQCNTDGLANTAEEKVANVTFQERAEISCLIPGFDGAIFSYEWKEALGGQVHHASATTTAAIRRAIHI